MMRKIKRSKLRNIAKTIRGELTSIRKNMKKRQSPKRY